MGKSKATGPDAGVCLDMFVYHHCQDAQDRASELISTRERVSRYQHGMLAANGPHTSRSCWEGSHRGCVVSLVFHRTHFACGLVKVSKGPKIQVEELWREDLIIFFLVCQGKGEQWIRSRVNFDSSIENIYQRIWYR